MIKVTNGGKRVNFKTKLIDEKYTMDCMVCRQPYRSKTNCTEIQNTLSAILCTELNIQYNPS